MTGCQFCGRSSHPFEIFQERFRLCKPCTLRVTVLEQNLTEVIELMEELFTYGPEPKRLLRHFQFYGRTLGRLFDGIASEKTKRNLFTILARAYTGSPVILGTDAFFENPALLREVREGIGRDHYLRKLFMDQGFVFFLAGGEEPPVPLQMRGELSETQGVWNLGEQFILEELEKEPIKRADGEDDIF